MQKFQIPVEWTVWDKVEVEANTLEEAVQYVKDHMEGIPLGTEPNYIDGSYKFSTEEQDNVDIIAQEIRDYYAF